MALYVSKSKAAPNRVNLVELAMARKPPSRRMITKGKFLDAEKRKTRFHAA